MLLGSAFDARQINLERGAASFFALHHHVSTTLLHDAVYGREAKPCALALFLGRKERLKDSRLGFFIHAHAGVVDREHDVLAGADEGGAAAMALIHHNLLRLDGERTAA